MRSNYRALTRGAQAEIAGLSEVLMRDRFLAQVGALVPGAHSPVPASLTPERLSLCLEAGMATFALHVESRIAAAVGTGFYTIGPCGEELLGAVGAILRPSDPMALHYRHGASLLARHLQSRPLAEVLLDRARAYTVSSLDPTTGGRHCSLGGGDRDYLVTSTLASQTAPAVGRALSGPLGGVYGKDYVSYVSLGDGSVNHAHFLGGVNLAEYARYRGYKCPLVLGISDNGVCISLRGHDWLHAQFLDKLQMPVFVADGADLASVWAETERAVAVARTQCRPVALVFRNLARRFGHAATDRQAAYLTADEIQAARDADALLGACALAVSTGRVSAGHLAERFAHIVELTEQSFQSACAEPGLTSRHELVASNSPALVSAVSWATAPAPPSTGAKQVMRKHMTRVYDEVLDRYPQAVYIGEDVQHGGYYLVTDQLASKYPHRVRDFPPEESALLGVGIGFAQAGLLPIVEVPYAKYLDCGADMFFEAAMAHWLSNGKQPNGMVLRLQGFDRGLFGGNFHTHNILHLPPGVDVVAYSNGPDYARGLRFAMEQARAGRVVMTVDCTHLLNLRHVHGQDGQWYFPYTSSTELQSWEDVRVYPGTGTDGPKVAVVAYGNGVVTALQARALVPDHLQVTVIDCPLISAVPQGLRDHLAEHTYDRLVFADICKQGQHPFAAFVCTLGSEGLLPGSWACVAATPTYNPLGSMVTFTSAEDIARACLH